MNLLLVFFKNRWPRQIIRLDDGRQIAVAELSIYLPDDLLAALDEWETLLSRSGIAAKTGSAAVPAALEGGQDDRPPGNLPTAIIAVAKRAAAAVAENNLLCRIPFPPPAAGGFTLGDVARMVRAAYGGETDLGKAPAPSSAPLAACAESVSRLN